MIHILSHHPEMAAHPQQIIATAVSPQEIHLNARDPQIAILYRLSPAGSLLRVTLWIPNDVERKNSVHSARFGHDSELVRGRRQERCVWTVY
ncbi:hypothetical protein BH24CHL4_BH24CHL4_12260 [soil metagenome]